MLKKTLIQNYTKIYHNDIIAIALVVIIGIIFSLMPHIFWLIKSGNFVSFADYDDILYLSYAGTAYNNHPLYLSDPVLLKGGSTIYPWLQFIPGVVIAKFLGIGSASVNIVWRLWAGISIPLAWYLLARFYLKNSWLSLVITVILMTDIGIDSCWLFYKQIVTLFNISFGDVGTLFQTSPQLFYQWRIITPGMSLAYLLIYLYLLNLALAKPTRTKIALAVVSFSLLFYVYFYYWTSAIVGLLISILLDSKNAKIYLKIGIFGILLGLPQLIMKFLIKSNSNQEWLPRTDNFLPIFNFSEFLLPRLAISLLFVTFFWVIFRRKDLVSLWSLPAAALLLSNHQILTGLQIQNFHWNYVYAPLLSFLVLLILLENLSLIKSKVWKKFLFFATIVLLSFYFTTGIWLRFLEVSQTQESVELTNVYHQYNKQRFNRSNVILEPRSVIAGNQQFVDFAVILENQRPLSGYAVNLSPAVDNNEWDARIALNDYLEGIDRPTFFAKQEKLLKTTAWGPWVRDKNLLDERLKNRQRHFDSIVKNPVEALKKFQVKYLAITKNKSSLQNLSVNWKLLEDGEYWQIWENKPDKST